MKFCNLHSIEVEPLRFLRGFVRVLIRSYDQRCHSDTITHEKHRESKIVKLYQLNHHEPKVEQLKHLRPAFFTSPKEIAEQLPDISKVTTILAKEDAAATANER